jgi:hypothetical protein
MTDPSRLTFPEDRTAFIYQAPGQPILTPFRSGLQLFTDAAGTVLADVLTPTGVPIANATIYTGDDGLLPLFLGPANLVTQLWARVVGGEPTTYPLFAQYSEQLGTIPTLFQGHGPPPADLGSAGSSYIDKDALTLYGPKGLTWPVPGQSLQGPQGPSGGFFQYQQIAPSDVWVIDHVLTYKPAVTVLDSAGSQVFGDVSYPLPNRVVIQFTNQLGGSALLS